MKSTVRVAGVQMVSTTDVDENLRAAAALIAQAAGGGASGRVARIFLPDGPARHRQGRATRSRWPRSDSGLSCRSGSPAPCVLVGGTLPLVAPENDRVLNTLLVYGPQVSVSRATTRSTCSASIRARKTTTSRARLRRAKRLRASNWRPKTEFGCASGCRSATTCASRSCTGRCRGPI